MQEVTIYCTNVLDTNTAFGVRADNGEHVFIPSSVALGAKVQISETLTAHIVPNAVHPEKTPWFAIRVTRDGAPVAPPVEKPKPVTLDDRIAEYIEKQGQYATTSEVAADFDIDTTLASNALTRLFKQGRVARADVHARPDQQRPSFCLWAKNTYRFIEEASE
jgi:hypothetical protein